MRIVFIGSIEFSEHMLKRVIGLGADVVGVVTKRKSKGNDDFVDLEKITKRGSIPCLHVKNINFKKNVEWIEKRKPDIIFCFGFSQILKKKILNIAPMGVVGYHPAKLPQNRGRHPLIWALVLGMQKTASTFFLMDQGIDSGDILDQRVITIDRQDTARSLYNKVKKTASQQISKLLPRLEKKSFKRIPQKETKANCWRQRGKKDGQIDFRMNSRAIYNLVRALTKPYCGAHLVYKGREIKVWEVREVNSVKENMEYGKVLKIKGRQILVRCQDKGIFLTKHEFKKSPKIGEYLL